MISQKIFSCIHAATHFIKKRNFPTILNDLISQNPPKNRKIAEPKPLKPLRKFKILSFRGVFLKNLGFL
ncbi:hypothetical protein C2S44_05325 [Helicobacter pylori]|nr:hypothetical protein C2S44_05325 [Helicobacter pylori]